MSDLNTRNDDNAAWLEYHSQWHPTVDRIMDSLQQAMVATAPVNHFTGHNEQRNFYESNEHIYSVPFSGSPELESRNDTEAEENPLNNALRRTKSCENF